MRAESKSTLWGVLLTGLLAMPVVALADDSCANFLAEKAAQGKGGWYALEFTVHREDISSVSYGGDTVGWLVPKPDGGFVGHSDQIFSERMSENQQPFDITYADDVNLALDRTGNLSVYHVDVSGETASDDSWNMTCRGSVLTTYVPNYGVVTLTFRDRYTPGQ
jgi:hypothetical protein